MGSWFSVRYGAKVGVRMELYIDHRKLDYRITLSR